MAAAGDSSGSRRWKLRWHPQAAHFSEMGSPAVADGDGMNSPQPSTAWPPIFAAWFFKHSLYVVAAAAAAARGGWGRGPPLMG